MYKVPCLVTSGNFLLSNGSCRDKVCFVLYCVILFCFVLFLHFCKGALLYVRNQGKEKNI